MTNTMVCAVLPELKGSLVAIEDLKHYEGNARKGNIALIRKSLESLTQFRPIVVRKGCNTVLAGNHTLAAAVEAGWTHIAVDWIECDDDQARRIVIADNRSSDKGRTDKRQLLTFLSETPELEGTGYDAVFLQRLESQLESSELFKDKLTTINGHKVTNLYDTVGLVDVGEMHFQVPLEAFMEWLHGKQPEDVAKAVQWPIAAIAINPAEARGKQATSNHLRGRSVSPPEGEEVEISKLRRMPGSPRRPATDVVMESVRVNGQYRRVLVNSRDNTVVINWAVVCAAKALGATTVRAVMADLDPIIARRIHLAENRTGEMAYYDEAMLADLLTGFDNPDGTGFTAVDVNRLLEAVGRPDAVAETKPKTYFRVRCTRTDTNWEYAANWDDWEVFREQLVRVGRYSDKGMTEELARRLELDPSCLIKLGM